VSGVEISIYVSTSYANRVNGASVVIPSSVSTLQNTSLFGSASFMGTRHLSETSAIIAHTFSV